MLRRAHSKSSNGLSRRKSASSIRTKQDFIDPDVARRQAQAAATYAFARAYQRENFEMGRGGGDSRDNEMLGQHHVADRSDETDQRGRGVKRQQSVRFTGPEAISRRQSIGTRASRASLEDKVATAPLRPRALTNNVPVPAAYRPPSRSSSLGKASIGKGAAQNIVTALAAYDEYYTREDDIASTPSSYRRIRKIKSTRTLSSPSKAGKGPFDEIMASNDYNSRIWNRVPWIPSQGQEAALRAPKSMSFLRGGREHMTPAIREDHDTAVQIARDKFLHQIEQQRLREQPSFLFRAKARREEKPFRQSVRSGSMNSYGLAVGSDNQITQPKESSLRIKVRKASQTFKKRLKYLFTRGTDPPEEAKIPDQQVEARASHGGSTYLSIAGRRQEESIDIPRPDSPIVSRVTSRIPSLYSVASNQQLKSRNGSISSQRSDGSGTLRATSWISTADDTAASRREQAEREAQRLSIIQENGTHVSSASFARTGVSNQFSAYPMLRPARSGHRRGGSRPDPVDGQKVQALMKRLDENSPKAKLEARRITSGEAFGPAIPIPPRGTSVSSHHSSRGSRTPATIRHVQDDAAEWRDERQRHNSTVTSLPHVDDDVFSPKPSVNTSAPLASLDPRSCSDGRQKVNSRDSRYIFYPHFSTGEGIIPPPQQQAARNELLTKPPKPPRETRSTFFGNSSFNVNRSKSPYRRALAEADYDQSVMTGEFSVEPSPNRILFAPPLIHCSDAKEVTGAELLVPEAAYSESVYSQTTSGRIAASESSQSLAPLQGDFRNINSSSVVPGGQRTYQPTGPTRSGNLSSGSARSKGPLNSEAIMIEDSKETDGLVSTINYALPSMPKHFGHFREHAQITGEDTEISQRKVSMKKQPIGILQQNMSQPIQLKPILKHKSSISSDKFPLPPPPPPPLPPPPVPIRSPLRPMQSGASLRSVDATSAHGTLSAPSSVIKQYPLNDHKPLRPKSLTNISRTDTPAKLVKRTRRPSNNFDPSPGIGAAVERQFGSVGSRTPYSGTENYSPADAARNEHYGSISAGHKEIGDAEAQAIGSRVMVDMFLSGRRRRVAGSDESNAFL